MTAHQDDPARKWVWAQRVALVEPWQEPLTPVVKSGPEDSPPGVFGVVDFDRGAQRLLEVIESSCDPDAILVEQLETAFCACLDLLAGDRELAYLLTAAHLRKPDLAFAHKRWVHAYGRLLRQAAERSSRTPLSPPFDEPYLIGAISWKIRGRVDCGIRQPLPQMRLDLMRLVLPHYFGLEEADRIVGPSELRSLGYLNGRKPGGPGDP